MPGNQSVDKEVLTLGEAARFIRVSEKTLGEMARLQRIPSQKVGREWRFLKPALEEWLQGKTREEAPSSPAQGEMKSASLTPRPRARELFEEAGFRDTAFFQNREEPLHRWVPWIAGFSASFVEGVFDSLARPQKKNFTVLDPFAGVGTTLVEGLKRGYHVVGFEINPFAALACRLKLEAWRYDLSRFQRKIKDFHSFMTKRKVDQKSPSAKPPNGFQSRVAFFSPAVERQVLLVLDYIASQEEPGLKSLFQLALGSVMIKFSNYSYEPSLGRRASAGKSDVLDADVESVVGAKLQQIAEDLALMADHMSAMMPLPSARIFSQSYFDNGNDVKPKSVDLLITSPPYLNNYHYLRNTRPQLYWLSLVEKPDDLKKMEHQSFGKFWQTVRSGPRVELAVPDQELTKQIEELRGKNSDRGVYGGWGWANYAATYFNDCLKFFRMTKKIMKLNGSLVIVVGNSILQGIEFKTDQILARIGEREGFQLLNLHRVRTKRTGSSIVNSSVRVGEVKQRIELYETAVELRAAS